MQHKKVKVCPTCGTENDIYAQSCKECERILSELVEIQKSSASVPHLRVLGENTTADLQKKSHLKSFLRMFAVLIFLLIVVSYALLLFSYVHRSGGASASSSGLGVIKTLDGGTVGINDGSLPPFDIGRNPQEMAFKQQAATRLKQGNTQAAVSLWLRALSVESNDAEALIYLEDQRVLALKEPYVTLVAGTAFPDTQYESELQGIYVAQHEFNTGKSALGLRILIANSGSNVSNTAAVAQQIVQIAYQDKTIVGVIGWLNSSNTENALSILAGAKIPVISPQASSDYLTGISPYFFRVVPPNNVQAQAAAHFMKNVLHVKNPVVFLDPNDLYSENLARDFEAQFAAGGHLQEETFKTDNTKNFSSLIQNALQYQPDAFYFTSPSSVDAGLFQDALPTAGPYAYLPVMAGDGGYAIHPNGAGRWYFTEYAFHGESTTPIATQFAQEYIADFNPNHQKPAGYYGYSLPDDHAILAYDATSVVLTALKMADANGKTTLTPQVLVSTLPTITGANAFQGVSGQISFGSNHDPINKAIVILYASKGGHLQLYNIQGCFVKGCQ